MQQTSFISKAAVLLYSASNVITCFGQKNHVFDNDLFFANLKGKVEKVEKSSFSIDSANNIIAQDSCCINIHVFDKEGFRTKEVYTDINNHEKSGQLYTKRFPNGLVEEIKFIHDGGVSSVLYSKLDTNNNYHFSTITDSSGKLISFYDSIEVNEFGRITSMTNFNPDSSVQQIVKNNYEGHTWTGGSIEDAKGNTIFVTKIELDKTFDPLTLTETVITNQKPATTIKHYKYTRYDEHGNWIEAIETMGSERKLLKRKIIYRAN